MINVGWGFATHVIGVDPEIPVDIKIIRELIFRNPSFIESSCSVDTCIRIDRGFFLFHFYRIG